MNNTNTVDDGSQPLTNTVATRHSSTHLMFTAYSIQALSAQIHRKGCKECAAQERFLVAFVVRGI
jgi:hypothetical protein